MSNRLRIPHRKLIPLVVATLVGSIMVVGPASPAAAAAAITVTPSTDLENGQTVSVSGTSFPPNKTAAILQCPATAQGPFDCDISTFVGTTADSGGAFSNPSFTVHRFLLMPATGLRDCVVDACVVAAGNVDVGLLRQPVSFVGTLPPPDYAIALSGPFGLDTTPQVTAAVEVTCNATEPVGVRFTIQQGNVTSTTTTTFPCVSWTTVNAFSDYMSGAGFVTGPIEVRAIVSGGPYPVQAQGTVTLRSQAQLATELTAGLQGPNHDEVLAQFIEDLMFRLLHNPLFRTPVLGGHPASVRHRLTGRMLVDAIDPRCPSNGGVSRPGLLIYWLEP